MDKKLYDDLINLDINQFDEGYVSTLSTEQIYELRHYEETFFKYKNKKLPFLAKLMVGALSTCVMAELVAVFSLPWWLIPVSLLNIVALPIVDFAFWGGKKFNLTHKKIKALKKANGLKKLETLINCAEKYTNDCVFEHQQIESMMYDYKNEKFSESEKSVPDLAFYNFDNVETKNKETSETAKTETNKKAEDNKILKFPGFKNDNLDL